MHILKSCTKQMEMTNSHQTYFWNLKLQRVLQFDYKLFLPQAMFLYRKKKRSWPFSVSVARQLEMINSFFFLREEKDLRNSKSGSQYLDSSWRVPFSSLSHASIYDRNAILNSCPFILVRLEVSSCDIFYRRTDSSVNSKLWRGTALQLA